MKVLASIFGNIKNKEVRKDLQGVSQARKPGLARATANGREPTKDSGKKRVAATPPNVIGAEVGPRRN